MACVAGRLMLPIHIQLSDSFGSSELGNALKSTRSIMPEFQPVASGVVSAIERPKCPKCGQNRMLLSKLEAAGSDYRTFERQRCGCIHKGVGIQRSLDLGHGRLARQRAKAADITASFSVKPAMQVERRIRLFPCGNWAKAARCRIPI